MIKIKNLSIKLGIISLMAGTGILFSMLGQLDIILSSWYCNPKNTWEFPLPFIFNKVITALEGWEIIYALIVLSALLMFLAGYLFGKEH